MVSMIFLGVLVVYGGITILRWIFNIYIFNHLMVFSRYFYVVLHELSHLIMGLLMGCGVSEVVLLPNHKNMVAGFYRGMRGSPFKILFINLGDALTSLAGPILPPVIIYLMLKWIINKEYKKVLGMILIFLILIIVTSPQRWIFLLTSIAIIYFGKLLKDKDSKYLNYLVLIFAVWAMLGMFDELTIIGGYNRLGSDMGNFTRALLKIDFPLISFILNKIIQVFYLYMIKVYFDMVTKTKMLKNSFY